MYCKFRRIDSNSRAINHHSQLCTTHCWKPPRSRSDEVKERVQTYLHDLKKYCTRNKFTIPEPRKYLKMYFKNRLRNKLIFNFNKLRRSAFFVTSHFMPYKFYGLSNSFVDYSFFLLFIGTDILHWSLSERIVYVISFRCEAILFFSLHPLNDLLSLVRVTGAAAVIYCPYTLFYDFF